MPPGTLVKANAAGLQHWGIGSDKWLMVISDESQTLESPLPPNFIRIHLLRHGRDAMRKVFVNQNYLERVPA